MSEPIGKKKEDGDGTKEEGGDGTELEISPSATVRTRENKAMSMDLNQVRKRGKNYDNRDGRWLAKGKIGSDFFL